MALKLECTRCNTTSTIEEWNEENMNIIPTKIESPEQWAEWKENNQNIILVCPEKDCGLNSAVIDIESY
ncbi:MAG: hypothetical protein ABI091_26490 [Ferruginibacter sp.]